ncbi:hypothetical protein PIB30_068172 [Stylosanthes scabra]|uniref:Uncharacterized protein n=1 Tax=Stylosanthes scabra TaxID=79078 RepID=A0ABU6XLB8_9FABA|nr:hypothetical protein [Stylosanthes scabra]
MKIWFFPKNRVKTLSPSDMISSQMVPGLKEQADCVANIRPAKLGCGRGRIMNCQTNGFRRTPLAWSWFFRIERRIIYIVRMAKPMQYLEVVGKWMSLEAVDRETAHGTD